MSKEVKGFILGMIVMFLLLNSKSTAGIKQAIFSLVNIEVNGGDKTIH